MKAIHCRRCGTLLNPGALKYIVQVNVTADFDGYITEEDWEADESLEDLAAALEKESQESAEQDVQARMAFFLCKRCKDTFMREMNESIAEPPPGGEDLLH